MTVLLTEAHLQISIHALLAESDAFSIMLIVSLAIFLSTLSLRRATAVCGSFYITRDAIFLSTLSLRRATSGYSARMESAARFLSTLSLRRATIHLCHVALTTAISIHALLAESDLLLLGAIRPRLYFYPRSPCGERRSTARNGTARRRFLSTLSLRRATFERTCLAKWLQISIHALLAESDPVLDALPIAYFVFLSTLSLRRATSLVAASASHHSIFLSTLSLRRATSLPCTVKFAALNFYPRSPCGERRAYFISKGGHTWISIHALLAESDYIPADDYFICGDFYPRSPCGERLPATARSSKC